VSLVTEVTLVHKTVLDSPAGRAEADNIITKVKCRVKAPAMGKFFCRVLVQRQFRAENADRSKRNETSVAT
jgi:hypothetical protein